MEVQQYFKQKKELYDIFLSFINNLDLDVENYESLTKFIEINEIHKNQEELKHFLSLLLCISNNHHRNTNFFNKIKQILIFLENSIKHTFSNFELFNFFNQNKLIILFLLNRKILSIDESIVDYMVKYKEQDGSRYCHFFIPEIKDFISEEKLKEIENEILSSDLNAFDNYEEKRQIGENDSYICSLIRSDSIVEFISFINRTNFSLSNKINSSIFETNSFLIGKTISLIEYAAFFGSIQIFQYLTMNNVVLSSSLWIFGIHSNDSNLIRHHIEANQIKPYDISYNECLKEAIKCHHNEIADYFKDNLLDTNYSDESIVSSSFHFCNYAFIPENLDENFAFFYLCECNYFKVVDFYLEMKKNEIEAEIIFKFN